MSTIIDSTFQMDKRVLAAPLQGEEFIGEFGMVKHTLLHKDLPKYLAKRKYDIRLLVNQHFKQFEYRISYGRVFKITFQNER